MGDLIKIVFAVKLFDNSVDDSADSDVLGPSAIVN